MSWRFPPVCPSY